MKKLAKIQTVSIILIVIAFLGLMVWDVVANYDALPVWKYVAFIVLAALQIKWACIVGRNAPNSKLEMIANIFSVPAINAIIVGCASAFMISVTGIVASIAIFSVFWSLFIALLCRVLENKPEEGKIAIYGAVAFLGNLCAMSLAILFGIEDAFSKLFAAIMILSVVSISAGIAQGMWQSATR